MFQIFAVVFALVCMASASYVGVPYGGYGLGYAAYGVGVPVASAYGLGYGGYGAYPAAYGLGYGGYGYGLKYGAYPAAYGYYGLLKK